MWDLFPNILLRNVLCVFLFWGGIYSPLRRVMYTEVFYTLTLGNRVFPDIFHPGLWLIHISIHGLLWKHFHTHLQEKHEISWGESFDSDVKLDFFSCRFWSVKWEIHAQLESLFDWNVFGNNAIWILSILVFVKLLNLPSLEQIIFFKPFSYTCSSPLHAPDTDVSVQQPQSPSPSRKRVTDVLLQTTRVALVVGWDSRKPVWVIAL